MRTAFPSMSAIRTRYGRLSNAPRHLRPSAALSTGRGASRRRQTSVAASGSSLPAALARRAPTAGVRPGGASTARPTRSAGSGPCGRHLRSRARASPSLSLGVLACEAVFPRPSVHRRRAAPCVPCVPFLACDLACLACTVQIKIVFIGLYLNLRAARQQNYLKSCSVRSRSRTPTSIIVTEYMLSTPLLTVSKFDASGI